MTSTGGLLYFDANDRLHGQNRGAATARRKARPIRSSWTNQPPPRDGSKSVTSTSNFDPVSYQGHAYFFGADINNLRVELWSSDGTAAGSQLFKDISPGGLDSNLQKLVVSGPSLFFQADDGVHGRAIRN